MMPEIALNILDVAENSVRAEADLVEIEVQIDTRKDFLSVLIRDNGCGMTQEQVQRVIDPFFTTRTTRKVGLGVPFFKQAAENADGSFSIRSKPGKGTEVKAVFRLSHIDRMPLGDISGVIHTLVVFHEPTEFCYRYTYDDKTFVLDTREMRAILGNVSLKEAEVSDFIKDYLETNKAEVDGGKQV